MGWCRHQWSRPEPGAAPLSCCPQPCPASCWRGVSEEGGPCRGRVFFPWLERWPSDPARAPSSPRAGPTGSGPGGEKAHFSQLGEGLSEKGPQVLGSSSGPQQGPQPGARDMSRKTEEPPHPRIKAPFVLGLESELENPPTQGLGLTHQPRLRAHQSPASRNSPVLVT